MMIRIVPFLTSAPDKVSRPVPAFWIVSEVPPVPDPNEKMLLLIVPAPPV